MKQQMVLVLGLLVMLSGCQQTSDEKDSRIEKENIKATKDTHKATQKDTKQSTENNEDKKPSVKVRVKSPENTSTEMPAEKQYDTAVYNEARNCLLAGTCTKYTDTPEYSRAWNNLATEGYLCQNHHCRKTEHPTAEVKIVPPATESVTTEQVTSETPTTEAPMTEQPSTEQMTTEEATVEAVEIEKNLTTEATEEPS
ncbi:hypothetical protein ERX27_04890 [Macrococcus brunensis]|uniref:Uncharacterized protein n=1 Tax=Macrococcus brunensis TaxID=198483 RepID=A0A4R6BE37_9STAP|nr:hypothetical protein [Macrococcus brunensis]TDL98015.1 hypothetical protein ERX27_04890 [Macrococcus brunensis]